MLLDYNLWMLVDNWVKQLSQEDFTEVLPLLRRTLTPRQVENNFDYERAFLNKKYIRLHSKQLFMDTPIRKWRLI